MFVEAQTLEVTWEWARMQGDLESSNSLGMWSAQWAGVWEPRREVRLYSLRGVLCRAERCWGVVGRGSGAASTGLCFASSATPLACLPTSLLGSGQEIFTFSHL